MGHENDGFLAAQIVNGFHDYLFRDIIKGAGGFVKNKDFRIVIEHPGKCQCAGAGPFLRVSEIVGNPQEIK